MAKTGATAQALQVRVEQDAGQAVTLVLSGQISLNTFSSFEAQMRALLGGAPPRLTVDLEGVEYLDSVGALGLVELREEAKDRDIPCSFVNVSENVQKILGLIDVEALNTPPLKAEEKPGFLEVVGGTTLKLLDDWYQILSFVGGLMLALFQAIFRPHLVRWNQVTIYMKRAGVDAFPILGLLSFLMGLVMAFMSALQLKQFGITIYVATLVAIAMVQEFGPLLTGIIVAGRSGSAFAAEIGTMMVNEEVDAIQVMGFDPIKFLAVPKVLASMIVVPILAVYAMLIGIVGGLVFSIFLLDLTVYTYVTETRRAILLFDVYASLVKSVVFAAIVAGIGCQRGFQVRGGAEAVGEKTTSAVVAGIFLIIVVDSIFAIMLHYMR
jgi:phospholipid/cholesterol/gamma-HCH transport system permease protein